MIYRIYSSDEHFKELKFFAGFNVLSADKTRNARRDQTRNAAGKSSFIEIVNFLMGGSVKQGDLFANKALSGMTFGMEFDLLGSKVCLERSTDDRNTIRFAGDVPKFIADEMAASNGDNQSLKVGQWNTLLGEVCFGINKPDKFGPSFRQAFPYFCRREEIGGIQQPFITWSKQPDWQRDVTIAFLLGLDWKILSQMEELRTEEKELNKLKKELKNSDIVGEVLGNATRVRSQLAIVERRLEEREKDLEGYQVLPEYRDVECEASQIARRIAELSDRNTADRSLIADLEESLENENVTEHSDVERLYKSAGVQLPSVALKRLESVQEFHKTVIRNRKSHLKNEIDTAKRRISEREAEAKKLSIRQKELMGLLNTHGALDQFNKLQEELGKMRTDRDLLKKRLELAHKIDKGGAAVKVKRATHHQQLVNDFDERENRLNDAVVLFADLSSRLSERSSVMNIEPTEKGLSLAITNAPSKSKGIREQQIFCLDMLLSVYQQKSNKHLGFLIHDSHLFDAMEERQVANAIEMGVELSKKHGFQYVITMNSDRIPYSSFSDGFDFDQYLIDTRLSDKTTDGGLFGFRFE